MPKYLTQSEAFTKCRKEGHFIITEEQNKERIKSMLTAAESDMLTAIDTIKNISKNDIKWNSVYKLFYDSLHELTEAFLLLKHIKIDNHQCLYAYLCEKYPELEFNWEFFEKIRTKRNGINYYGSLIQYSDWKEVEMFYKNYTSKLRKEIEKNIK